MVKEILFYSDIMNADEQEWDIYKLGSMIRYITEENVIKVSSGKRKPIHKKRIHLLCYLCDFNNFELYGRSISGAIYVKGKDGPVPIFFDKVLKELVTDDIITLKNNYIKSCSKILFSQEMECCAPENYQWLKLSREDQFVIGDVMVQYGTMKTKKLRAIVKDDTPVLLAGDCQAIDLEFVTYRSDDMKLIGGDEDEW